MAFVDILIVFASILLCCYFYVKHKYAYWLRKGVPFVPPRFPFGNIRGIGNKLHSSQVMTYFYNEMKSKGDFGGIFFFIEPVILAIDLDFIKNVLIKDFNYFMDRGIYFNEEKDPLSAHLLSIEGTKWKNLRAKLTPTFSSGKIKAMTPTIVEVADQFRECLKDSIKDDSVIEMRDILGRFTTDVIGTCAFGLDCNSLKDPETEFRRMGKRVFDVPRNIAIKQFFMMTCRDFSRKLGLKQVQDDVSEFFMKVVKDTINYREKNNIQRNDFMNLLIQLKNNGKLDGDANSEPIVSLSVEQIAAQAFVFFLAGFETSSTTMSYCLYELSLHQEIQDKARTEVRRVMKNHGGKITYEAVLEMKFIDQIINESLRKYPPGSNLVRVVTKDYLVPNTDIVLEKGCKLMISVYAIHHDPEIYPDPEVFNPDRFTEEEVHKRHPCAFMPFGEGPRNCIGLRFGMMQARIGLATLIANFKFQKSEKSVIPLVFSKKSMILTPLGGLWLDVQNINDDDDNITL